MKYTVESTLENFEAWSGGKYHLEILRRNGDCDEVECLIEMNWPDEPPTETEINDLLWFGEDEIAEHLGFRDWEDYERSRGHEDEEEDEDDEESDDEQLESEDEGSVDYVKLADDFAKATGTKLTILFKQFRKFFDSDLQARYVFKCKLTRNRKSYTFFFGQSIANGSTPPTMYDILACMTKSDPGTLEEFCDEFGYDTDSRKAERVYRMCCHEWDAMQRLFGDVMDQLADIN